MNDKNAKHPVKTTSWVVQKDKKAGKNLVNVSSKYIGDHQSLFWLFSSLFDSYFFLVFLLSFFIHLFHTKNCIVWRMQQKNRFTLQEEDRAKSKKVFFDKILNSHFIVSTLKSFLRVQIPYKFSEIDGGPLGLPNREARRISKESKLLY